MDSYDIKPGFTRLTTVVSRLRVGDRDDFVWARLTRPIPAGPNRSLKTTIYLAVVALGPRHLDATWSNGPWPLHVYVCRPIDSAKSMADELQADDLAIEVWATLTREWPSNDIRGR